MSRAIDLSRDNKSFVIPRNEESQARTEERFLVPRNDKLTKCPALSRCPCPVGYKLDPH